ncbi:DUF4232 domain-containing protein [Streptomyces sp. Je 1-332]|uniref:DUF4232 domain-containing protein n=1 Tax=Streptomyces sp. Je 1-332 TaxID=3231270 RepID=UPI003458B61C
MRSNTNTTATRRRNLRFAAAALTVAASLSLTACNGDDVTGQGDPSAASSASSSGGGSGSGGGSEQSGGSEQGGGSEQAGGKDSAGKSSSGQGAAAGSGAGNVERAEKCRTDDLDISATDSTIDGDDKGSVAVTFKNPGDRGCLLSGFAGIDLKTNAGDLSATREGKPAEQMVLTGGESVSFYVSYPMNDTGGSGVRITGLVVTPPGETKSQSLQWPGAASLPVSDGSGSSVKVGPIGSAGQGGPQ